jgi:hypothetical protein
MYSKDEITPIRWEMFGPFAVCETMAEMFVAAHKVGGLEMVESLLTSAGCAPGSLWRAARELRVAGLVQLAALVGRYARRAKRPPWWRDLRPGKWRTPSAEVWIKHRRMARLTSNP